MRDYSDQEKIFDATTWGWPVHLVGAGGINNLVGPMLAKMGIHEIHVWDDDILENRNFPAEVAYSYRMVECPKINAMEDAIHYLMGDDFPVHKHFKRVSETTRLSGVVICGVDSMKSRQEIWRSVQNNYLEIPLFIDGRSAGEISSLFAFSPVDFESAEAYEQDWLFDDAETTPLACGARNIAYVAGYMATAICRLIVRFHRQLPIEFCCHHDFVEMISL